MKNYNKHLITLLLILLSAHCFSQKTTSELGIGLLAFNPDFSLNLYKNKTDKQPQYTIKSKNGKLQIPKNVKPFHHPQINFNSPGDRMLFKVVEIDENFYKVAINDKQQVAYIKILKAYNHYQSLDEFYKMNVIGFPGIKYNPKWMLFRNSKNFLTA